MEYLAAKALHIIGFVAWFAGLFYITRLFIYDVEANGCAAPERAALQTQLRLMQKRLWYAITVPAMVFTWVCGLWLLAVFVRGTGGVVPPWLIVKLSLLLALVGYHHLLARIRKQLLNGTCRWTSLRLRMLNEVASVFLVTIVFVAVFKSTLNATIAVAALAAFGGVLMLVVKLLHKKQEL